MMQYNLHIKSVDCRIAQAIHDAWRSYCSKLASGYYEQGLEDTVKLHFASVLEKCLDLVTLFPKERFIVALEKNLPLKGGKDYIDIVIEHFLDAERSYYPIELKFKKIGDGAYDYGVIDSYKDIRNLELQKEKREVKKAFFIFLTTDIAYTKESTSGTRALLPMHDGAKIAKGREYRADTESARKRTKEFGNAFRFNNDYEISYSKFAGRNKEDYYYFILEI